MMDDATRPALSVAIPAYNSHDTLAGCLEALERQTFRDFETIVVDSGPDGTGEQIVSERFPWVRFERSALRLLPHAARNRGVELARSELIVFTDPDIYARPDWLERLLDAYRATGEVVVGSLACHGDLWRDQGIHLCKFSKWLPGGRPRCVDMSPTANMLIAKQRLAEAGGLPGDAMLGDVVLSRGVLERGGRLWFEPRAVVEHHHLQTVGAYLRERYTRGRMFGEMRAGWLGERRGRLLAYLAVTVLPIRLTRVLGLVALHAGQAGQTGRYVSTLPLVVLGHAASLAGEAAAYTRRLVPGRWRRTAPAGGRA